MSGRTATKTCKWSITKSNRLRLADLSKMQMNINEHDKNMMKVTMTLERQIEEKNETIDRYKEVLKRKREQADIEKKKIKDTFEKEKKDADKHRELGLAEQAL